jgi:hypothetical protein
MKALIIKMLKKYSDYRHLKAAQRKKGDFAYIMMQAESILEVKR